MVELVPVPAEIQQNFNGSDDEEMPQLEQIPPPQDPRPPLNQRNPEQENRDLAVAAFLRQNPPSSGDSGIYSPGTDRTP